MIFISVLILLLVYATMIFAYCWHNDNLSTSFKIFLFIIIAVFIISFGIVKSFEIYERPHNHDKGIVVEKYDAYEKVGDKHLKYYYVDVYYEDCDETIRYKMSYMDWSKIRIDSEFKIMEGKK